MSTELSEVCWAALSLVLSYALTGRAGNWSTLAACAVERLVTEQLVSGRRDASWAWASWGAYASAAALLQVIIKSVCLGADFGPYEGQPGARGVGIPQL